jgi:hypothetical protein
MIKALKAQTCDLDDTASAVSEVLAQLGAKGELLGNSVGILTCHPDFVETGVVKALCEALPFDVVGSTTVDGFVLGGVSATLSLLVLTSDDVFFSTALSQPMDRGNLKDAVRNVCLGVLDGLPSSDASVPAGFAAGSDQKCAMLLTFVSFTRWAGGDEILRILDEVSGGVPLFGIVSPLHTTVVGPPVLFNGEAYTDCLALVALSGDVHPRFATVSISEEKISKTSALVTDAEGNVLKALDGIPVIEYLEKFSLAEKGRLRWEITIPLIVDCQDGVKPVSLIIVDQTPDGYVRTSASLPLNSTVRVGSIDHGDILKSIADVAGIVDKKTSAFFFFSCALRGFAMNMSEATEVDRVKELLSDSVPFLFAYAGGEICPLYAQNGRLVNRFHNMTAIGCAL